MDDINGRVLCKGLYNSAFLCPLYSVERSLEIFWILQKRTVRPGPGTDLPAPIAAIHPSHRVVHREYTLLGSSDAGPRWS